MPLLLPAAAAGAAWLAALLAATDQSVTNRQGPAADAPLLLLLL
jgi:hypothetical protein